MENSQYVSCITMVARHYKEKLGEKITVIRFAKNDRKDYEIKALGDSAIYASKPESGHLAKILLYNSVKKLLQEKNIWKSLLTSQHLKKLTSYFHKKHLMKPATVFCPFILLCQ